MPPTVQYPDFLGIPSPEMEEVSRILGGGQQQTKDRPYYGSAQQQSLSDYHAEAERMANERDNLALQAEVQRRISLPTTGGRSARQIAWRQALQRAQYENQTKALIDDLTRLDAADPEFGVQQDEIFGRHPIAREALRDPRVANMVKRQAAENEEMQTIFDKDRESRQEYANLRAAGRSPTEARKIVKDAATRRAERVAFAMSGGNPAEFDSGKFNGPDGNVDRAKLAYALSQRKAESEASLSSAERKALDSAVENLVQPDLSDAGKVRAFERQFKRRPATEEEWTQAYRAAEADGQRERDALAALIEDLERSGKRVSNLYKNMARGTRSTVTSADENQQTRKEGMSGMSGQSSQEPSVLQGVQGGANEGMEGKPRRDSGSTSSGQRSQLREGVPQEGQDRQGSVPDMRQSGQSNASSGLQQASSGGVVLPTSPSSGSQASGIPTVSSPAQLRALNLAPGSRFKTPDGQIRIVK